MLESHANLQKKIKKINLKQFQRLWLPRLEVLEVSSNIYEEKHKDYFLIKIPGKKKKKKKHPKNLRPDFFITFPFEYLTF